MTRVLLRACVDGQEFPLYFDGPNVEEQISHACVMLGATEIHRAVATEFEMQCEQVMILSQAPRTYEIIQTDTDMPGITCLRCHRTSYNRNDVQQRYCGFCRVFHDDTRES